MASKMIIDENGNLSEIGKQIEKIRCVRGYSRLDLAKGTGISKSRLNEIIVGKYNPRIEVLDRLAECLDVPSDYLLIYYHRDFVLFAIDDYLMRIRPAALKDIVSDMCDVAKCPIFAEDCVLGLISALAKKQIADKSLFPEGKIKRYRKSIGYTQAQASEAIGVSYNHYVKHENGLTAFSFENHLLLCRLLQKSSECITQDIRTDMILNLETRSALSQMKNEWLSMLLEFLRLLYETEKHMGLFSDSES